MAYTNGEFSFIEDINGQPVIQITNDNFGEAFNNGRFSFIKDENGKPILRVIDLAAADIAYNKIGDIETALAEIVGGT